MLPNLKLFINDSYPSVYWVFGFFQFFGFILDYILNIYVEFQQSVHRGKEAAQSWVAVSILGPDFSTAKSGKFYFGCFFLCRLIVLLASSWILIFHIFLPLQLSPNLSNSGKSIYLVLCTVFLVFIVCFMSCLFFPIPRRFVSSRLFLLIQHGLMKRLTGFWQILMKLGSLHPSHHLFHSSHLSQYLKVKGLLEGAGKIE